MFFCAIITCFTIPATMTSFPVTRHRPVIEKATNLKTIQETAPLILKDLSNLALKLAAFSQDSTLPLYFRGNLMNIDWTDHVRNAGLALTLQQLAPYCSDKEASECVQKAAKSASRKIINTWPHDIQACSFSARALEPLDGKEIQNLRIYAERASEQAIKGLLEPRFERGEVLISLCELKESIYPDIRNQVNRAIISGLNPSTWGPFSSQNINEVFELNWYSQFLRAAHDAGFEVDQMSAKDAAFRLIDYAPLAAELETNFRVVTLEGISSLLPMLKNESEDTQKRIFIAIQKLLLSCLAPEAHVEGCEEAIAFIRGRTIRFDISGHFVSALALLLAE
jgi:hypothetical protein